MGCGVVPCRFNLYCCGAATVEEAGHQFIKRGADVRALVRDPSKGETCTVLVGLQQVSTQRRPLGPHPSRQTALWRG